MKSLVAIADLLHKHRQWDTIPTLVSDTNSDDSDDEDEDDEDQTDQDMESVINSVVQEDPSAVEADIAKLSDSLITSELKDRLCKLQQSLPKLNRIPGTSISMFTSSSLDEEVSKEIPQKTKEPTSLPFVEVSIGSNDCPLFVCKTTAVTTQPPPRHHFRRLALYSPIMFTIETQAFVGFVKMNQQQ